MYVILEKIMMLSVTLSYKDCRVTYYLDSHCKFKNTGKITSKLFGKHDDSNIQIVPFPNSNILIFSAYGVLVSKHVRYTGGCSYIWSFLNRQFTMGAACEKLALPENLFVTSFREGRSYSAFSGPCLNLSMDF